jgi:hypothetical protein
MSVSGPRLSNRCGIRQAPACVVAGASAYLLLSMNVRSVGSAKVDWSDIGNEVRKPRRITEFGTGQRNDFGYRQTRTTIK